MRENTCYMRNMNKHVIRKRFIRVGEGGGRLLYYPYLKNFFKSSSLDFSNYYMDFVFSFTKVVPIDNPQVIVYCKREKV